jgi:hypothetical protein
MARKHITQCNPTERAFIHGYIRSNVHKVNGGNHFYDRANERHYSLSEARDALAKGLVVEVHNDRTPDIRALVRHSSGICTVVSLKTWEVITVYYNAPSDNHDTLNYNAYRWSVNVTELVKTLRRIQ